MEKPKLFHFKESNVNKTNLSRINVIKSNIYTSHLLTNEYNRSKFFMIINKKNGVYGN